MRTIIPSVALAFVLSNVSALASPSSTVVSSHVQNIVSLGLIATSLCPDVPLSDFFHSLPIQSTLTAEGLLVLPADTDPFAAPTLHVYLKCGPDRGNPGDPNLTAAFYVDLDLVESVTLTGDPTT